MNILDYLKQYRPDVSEEYFRFLRKDRLPSIGTEVITLVNGYSGYAGATRYIVAHDDRYIHLAHVPNGRVTSLCDINEWWKDLKIVNEPEVDKN